MRSRFAHSRLGRWIGRRWCCPRQIHIATIYDSTGVQCRACGRRFTTIAMTKDHGR